MSVLHRTNKLFDSGIFRLRFPASAGAPPEVTLTINPAVSFNVANDTLSSDGEGQRRWSRCDFFCRYSSNIIPKRYSLLGKYPQAFSAAAST